MENLRGMALMTGSMLAFAIEDAFIKASSTLMPVGQILIILGLGGALVFGLIAHRQGVALFTRDIFAPIVMLRNLGEMLGTMAFVSALAMTSMSLVAAMIQAMPLLVTMGAALFFGAKVGWRRWSAIGVGFCGVLLIIRPGSDAFDFGAVIAFLAVLGMSARDLATRAVPAKFTSMQLSCYGFAAIVPAGVVLLSFSGGAVMPDVTTALWLMAALICGILGYYALVLAMRMGDISVITPFRYTRLLFALAIGAMVFGDRPDAVMLLGAGIVIAAGLYTLIREARMARAQRGLSTAGTSG